MKGKLLIVICLFFLCACKKKYVDVYYTIKLQHLASPTTADLHSLYFVSATTGYIAGAAGKVFKTTNSTSSWSDISLPVQKTVYKIWFLDTYVGFAGTEDGIFRTMNGGSTWTQLLSNIEIHGIYFTGANTGYAVGSSYAGLVYKTTDNGQTWTDITPGFGPKKMKAVFFVNPNNGYIAAEDETIYSTQDGGKTWKIITSGNSIDSFNDIYCTDDNNCYAVRDNGKIINYNSGNSRDMLLSYGYHINAIDMYSGSMAAVGEKSVMIPYKDNNTGNTYFEYMLTPEGTTLPYTYNDVKFSDASTFYAIGNGGVITKFMYPE